MKDQLQIAFAQTDITPAIADGVYLDGYGFRTSPAEGVLSHLYAKVCVLQSGTDGKPFAIFSLDICGTNDAVQKRLRHWICALSPLTDAQFALCATHTHAGPAAGVLWGLPVNMLYWDKVGKQLGAMVGDALSRMVAGELRLHDGAPFTASVNRRGKEIIDRRVPICAAYSAQGELLGMLVSASCHAVASNDMRISADYPGVMAELVSGAHGNVPVLFLQGRGADINPTEEAMSAGETRPEVPGKVLADCVASGLSAPEHTIIKGGKLSSVTRDTILPYSYPDADKIQAKIEEMKKALADGIKPRSTEMELLWQMEALAQVKRDAQYTTVPIKLQLLSIGALTIAFLPFELLTSTGNAIEAFLPAPALVIGYANGTHGYLAPAEECGLGDYESCRSAHWYGMPECLPQTEKALLILVEALSELL